MDETMRDEGEGTEEREEPLDDYDCQCMSCFEGKLALGRGGTMFQGGGTLVLCGDVSFGVPTRTFEFDDSGRLRGKSPEQPI